MNKQLTDGYAVSNCSDENIRFLKTAKFVRVITLPPIMALITLIILWYSMPDFFTAKWEFWAGAGCLTFLPTLSYAIQKAIPSLKGGGRKIQRQLAVIASVIGYLACNVTAWAADASAGLKTLYLTYLLSVTAIAFLGAVFKIKCSGHACGLCGPIAYLTIYVSSWYGFALLLLIPMFWASLKIKRHKLSELTLGCVVTVVALLVSHLIFMGAGVGV